MKYVIFMVLCVMSCVGLHACTSAIISGRVSATGRPLLWKHRDTSKQDNKVERVAATDSTFEYVALYNADDTDCREAWIGYNSQGFAVMNTAVYNLKDDTVTCMDKEGLVMTEALKCCVTVGDFELLLRRLPKPLGVEANFGVIDAQGNGAYFETGNYGFVKFDLADAENGVLVRSNYAHSGRDGEGKGYARDANALHMLEPYIDSCSVSAELLTETLSRQFYYSRDDKDFTYSEKQLIADQEFIPRYISTATVVIEGVIDGESPLLTTMWVGLGYPPCAEIRAVWLDEDVPAELRGSGDDGHSPLCDVAVARRDAVFSTTLDGKHRIDLGLLYNRQGTGFCQKLIEANKRTYSQGYRVIARKREAYGKPDR